MVSLNLCTDEYLLLLAPEQVAALSPLARDPALSVVAARAAGMPRVQADAEAVMALRPDLVLAGTYGAQAVLAVLRARGLRVVQVPEAVDFAGIERATAGLAATLGVPARGAALVAVMRATLAGVAAARRGSAVLWEARGFAAGPGSFGAAVLAAAGYENAGTGGQMGIEALVARPPGTLVTASAPAYPSLSTALLDHPALAALAGLRRRTVDPALLACPGPWSAGAVVALAR